MLSKGNGAPEVCVQNLLKTIRGEVPYERIKGLDRALIGAPSGDIVAEITADAQYVIKTYEPRVDVNNVKLEAAAPTTGGFVVTAEIKSKST